MSVQRNVLTIPVLAVLCLGSLAWAQTATPSKTAESLPEDSSAAANALLPKLPPMPTGKATVVGGAISSLDRVRDQITLYVFGGGEMKVLFDERTLVYRDGMPASQRDLRNGEHISVETVLDGTTIFARSIHVLAQIAEGECRGQVLSYDRGKGELLMRDPLSPEPVKLRVAASTVIDDKGQQTSADLLPGALIAVQFQPGRGEVATARQISVLATPGSAFTFVGRVAYLDLHAGLMVVVDPRDKKRYEISFEPSLQMSGGKLREGEDVTVAAGFSGNQYMARSIMISSPSGK
jgi:Domain of unknown function (DUF5666)